MQKPLVLYIDMDDVLCDFSNAHRDKLATNPAIAFPQSQYGFYTNLKPLENAIESVNRLIEDARFEPYILTAPSYLNPLCYTEKRMWVEAYLGLEFTQKLIISTDKSLLCGDVLIDDKAFGNGQDKFEGKLFQFGTSEYPNWLMVIKQLIDLVNPIHNS